MQEIYVDNESSEGNMIFFFFLSPAPQHWNAQFFLQKRLSLVQVLREFKGLSGKLKIVNLFPKLFHHS